jgi:Transcriptional regulator, AbiEi antitoxin
VGLAELAARQHGVVSIRQLETLLGYSRRSVLKAVRAGRLHPLHRGVYAVGHRELSLQGQCLAAVLAVGPGSLLSYWSAAWLWGLLETSPRPFHVTAPGPRRLRHRPPVKVHRARNLVEADRAQRERVPVTNLARTLLDLTEVLKPERLPKVLERAEKLEQFDGIEVRAVCERSRAHRGSKRLLTALGAHRPTLRVLRSDVERDFLALLETSGLPLPASNYFVGEHEIDAYWPDLCFGVELDTFDTHGGRLAFEVDRERDAALLEQGITTIRVTDLQLQSRPDELLRRLSVLLGRAR